MAPVAVIVRGNLIGGIKSTGYRSLAAASAAALFASILGAAIAAAPAVASSPSTSKPKVIKAIQHDRSLPLSSLHGVLQSGKQLARTPGHGTSTAATPAPRATVVAGDPVLQTIPPAAAGPSLAGSFEGIGAGIAGYFVGYSPSDVNGAIGPNVYLQIANASLAVFRRDGTLLLPPEPISTLWTGFGGLCATTNGGDPIALYDHAADRWLVSQLAFSGADGTSVPYLNCVAVSTSGDPTGAYFRYAFPRSELPDYSKFSVWPDAYYMTDNDQQNGTNFTGPSYAALDRTAMLAGGPGTMIVFSLGTSYQSLLPAGQDGPTPPPAGSPGYALALRSDMAGLNEWRLHADFATPANSTLTGPIAIPVAPFGELCNGFFSCVPQASPGIPLAAIGDRLMYRVAYRNFGDHESLVASHSVDPGQGGNTSGGVRWYEIRNPAGTPAVYQQGTFAPDSGYRWMGSVAMDARGDIAAGYSLVNSSLDPSIALTGRLAGDPLGALPQGETMLATGTGVQSFPIDRWGDYTSMAMDPVDDCTFWYTNQYLTTTGTFNWHTRVGSFRYPSCSLAASSTALTSSPNPSTGAAVTLSATVTGIGPAPTGSVEFQDGQQVLGTAPLIGAQATLSLALLGGARSLAATYSGDATYSGSSSPLVTQQVNLPATTSSLAASTGSTSAAGPVTFTAAVSGTSGTPTGSVTFFDGGLDLGSAVLSSGQAGFTTSGLAVGAHNITASYSGDTANAASTSNSVSVAVSGPGYSQLYNFTAAADGGAPQGGVTQGLDGAFYGTTTLQGSGTFGTIFRFTPAGGLVTLHTLADADGGSSHNRLLLGADGALYGTSGGSSSTNGTIWRITTQGAFSVLHTFNGTDGAGAASGLVQGPSGTLYGGTTGGGQFNRGIIYSITPAGTLTTLYSFTGGADGNGLSGTLAFGPDGNLYGTSLVGGARDLGTIFRITPSGTFATLYSFSGGADGLFPQNGLLLGADGNLYGTTNGGSMGRGTIYRITPAGSLTTLYEMSPGDGSPQLSGLVQDAHGILYGEAYRSDPSGGYGTIFELTGGGVFVRLRSMDFHTGANPLGGLTLASDGNLYGTDSSGGLNTWGVIFALNLAPPLVLSPAALGPLLEGASVVLTLAQASGGAPPYSASINWGDGTTSAGAVTSGGSVSGTHAWAEETGSPDTVSVTVTDSAGRTATVTDIANVTDAAITATASAAQSATEGTPWSGVLATFTDADPGGLAGDYTATVAWGDGTATQTGSISGTGPFSVSGTHTFVETAGTVTITITDAGGATTSAQVQFTLAEAPLSASSVPVQSVEGGAFNGTVATFTDANSGATAGDFTAIITWGDGSTSNGTVSGAGPFTVTGTHTWAEESSYAVSVTITDSGGPSVSVTDTATVADAPLSGTASAVPGAEGTTISATVATFTDGNGGGTASEFVATITWGDGSTSTGLISGTGPFSVSGAHTYIEGGSYPTSVTIRDAGGSTLTVFGAAEIRDFELTLTGVSGNVSKNFSGTVAKLGDADPTAVASDYSVTIDWGDGTTSSGRVNGKESPFTIAGTHTYETRGTYTVTITVRDAGNGTATTTSTLTVH